MNESRKIVAPKRIICVKCPEKGSVVLNQKDVYCRKCFLHFVSHKFRSTLGKQKIFSKSNDKVLLAFSGGASSSALLDLIDQSLDENEQKKLKIDPIILYLSTNDDERMKICDVLNSKNYKKFPHFIVPFSSIFYNFSSSSIENFCVVDEKNEEKFKKLFQSAKNETSRRDLLQRLKLFFLIRLTRILNVRFLMVGDNCSKLSSEILSDVSQGRGGQIKDRVSVVDKRWTDVVVVRPLRELQIKEITLYNYFREVEYFSSNNYFLTPSIQTETNDFVVSLHDQFPATVCTLFSTASKLASLKSYEDQEQKCKLCSSSVENGAVKNFCYGCDLTIGEVNSSDTVLPRCVTE